MPYKSKKQEAWAHSPEGLKALGGKDKVAEWDSASKGLELPDRVPAKKSKPKNLREADFRTSVKKHG